ncbi:lipoprotein [Mycoplasmoides pneumoniae]|uniref:Uncharacterized lipoprotein MPN_411 n=2 Tax=Mycoplasmoides pneumoniae TaxID=2104 RepID=Y411_MYCPN|nr:MPN647 family lipoprotein [Mycoplasmoides pneumoniae]P75373.1 RecName: Full=Uncharacterized lipoprotein MPN_411; Flags: Precursor [Mycoplasmoides pneumoniae M129]AAB96075.1 conserved hypothetical protein [Mycoplasmoides pneumoniae M129]AGC04319.1 hypothetical protein C985_0420 [Mycoplasmoides pneumoniae M129-B7]ALA30290.1 hypothetical protein C897_02355 [Mycoplasmoides pneumoniae PI 1428]ALA32397.1 hypothetical protein F533_02355 [Mycoplasmoides pneumoniae 51494]ALA33097.1 hypothetical pro
MRKKKFLSRFAFGSLFLLCGTILSACTGIQADLRNLIKEATGKDIDLSKSIKTTDGKKNIITSSKKSYEVNPKDTTKLLLEAWKQSFEEGKLGIAELAFDQATNPTKNSDFKMERKVEYFNMEYKSFSDFSVNARLSYIFNWYGSYFGEKSFTANNGGKHNFDLFLSIKSHSKKQFTEKSFIVKDENFQDQDKSQQIITEWIQLDLSLIWSLKGQDELSRKSLDKIFLKDYITYSANEKQINLFTYLQHLIK